MISAQHVIKQKQFSLVKGIGVKIVLSVKCKVSAFIVSLWKYRKLKMKIKFNMDRKV